MLGLSIFLTAKHKVKASLAVKRITWFNCQFSEEMLKLETKLADCTNQGLGQPGLRDSLSHGNGMQLRRRDVGFHILHGVYRRQFILRIFIGT